MKKSILLALLALALPASAGTINWELKTAAASNYMVGKDGNKLTGTAYLFLTDSLSTATFKKEQDIINLALDANDDGNGGLTGVLTIVDGVNKNTGKSTDSRLTVDGTTSYSFTVLIYDSVNKSYFTSSVAKSETAYNLSGDEFTDEHSISFNAQQLYATAALRGTQTWTSVPEPSTAALALAGLALLLKRRKA